MLKKMSAFSKVVECGSFTKAGEILGVSPSSISRQISQLEEEIDGQLLKRTARSVTLTEVGKEYYKQVCHILSDIENLNARIKEYRNVVKGTLNISVFESFGHMYVAPLIPEFLERHPDLQVELDLNNHVVDLYRDRFDIGIRIGIPHDSRLIVRPLVNNAMLLCASPSYIEKYGEVTHPEQLLAHNCLTLSRSRKTVKWSFCKEEEEHHIEVKGNLVSAGGQALAEAARQGMGYVLLPEWMLHEEINRGSLISCMPEWEANIGRQHIYAFYLRDKSKQKNIRAFIDFMFEKLPAQFIFG